MQCACIRYLPPRLLQYSRGSTDYGRRLLSSRRNEKEATAEAKLDREIADIEKRVHQYTRQLRRHVVSSFKSRELSSSIAALRLTMSDAQRKKASVSSTTTDALLAAFPAHVSIEILSNGTTHMPPTVAIRTPLKTYLFNCPEGTSRFLPALRLKPTNIYDIFITRCVWDNIGGISSILLAKESNSLCTRLHGAVNVKHFLECIRPFQDSDFGSVKYPSSRDEDDPVQYPCKVEECSTSTHDSYEDAGLRVVYIPLLGEEKGRGAEERKRKSATDVAYYIELKEPPRRIDPLKLISLKVPKGPLIGNLKRGETVTLPDGKAIRPEDVMSTSDRSAEELRRCLIVDCADESFARSLIDNSLVSSFSSSTSLNFVVHLSPPTVIDLPFYRQWAQSLGPQCTHIVVNGSGPLIPSIDSMYRHSRFLHNLQPALFDELVPRGWRGIVTQEKELERRDERGWVYGAPLQRWMMRTVKGEETIVIDLKEEKGEEEWREDAKEDIRRVKEEMEGMGVDSTKGDSFPVVSFLGTSSATPSKYRNVSGYLFETGPSSAFLIDVGEGSYGQLRVLLGEEDCERTMLNLHAVFITHAHQDHMNGLYTVIERRRDAFIRNNLPYVPLVLICNKNVLKPLKTYTHCFEDLERYVEVVDLATSNPSQYAPSSPKRVKTSGQGDSLITSLPPSTCELINKMPASLYDADKWKLEGALAVQVHHTRMANAFVLTTGGKKIVFSGDTKPCDLLIEKGVNADLLIHEATFEDGHEVDAARKKHSTMGQAVQVAEKMKAKNCILSHFSARYPKVPPLPMYLDEKKIGLAMDGLRVRFDRLHLVPLMNPIYRQAFREELFEIELKKSQRELRGREKQNEENEGGLKDSGKGRGKNRSPLRV